VSGDAPSDALVARVTALAKDVIGRAVVGVEPLAPGLGRRRFLRLRLAPGEPATLIARAEPDTAPATTGAAPEPPLEPIRALLERAGLPVPARFGAADGVELLEDVGDVSLERAVAGAAAAERRALYDEAVSLVPRLQSIRPDRPGIAAFDRRLDAALIASKAQKWLEWTIPFALGRSASAAERAATGRAFDFVASVCADAPARLAHRDFKAANLHCLPVDARRGRGRLVLIDLQGAFLAPPEYDLVCLLRDSHVALPEEEVRAHLQRVRPALPDRPDPDRFARRLDLLTVVRVAKDVSHYVDAASHRNDRRYLPLVATGMRNLRAAAERAAGRDAALADFAASLAAIPDDFAARTSGPRTGRPPCGP